MHCRFQKTAHPHLPGWGIDSRGSEKVASSDKICQTHRLQARSRQRRSSARKRSGPLRALFGLLQGAPPTVLPSLWNLDRTVADTMCTYDPLNRRTSPPPPLPWPVFWLLSHFSAKHRFCMRSPPSFRWLVQDIDQFRNKFHRRLHFSESDSDRPRQPFRIRGRRTPACSHQVHPDFRPWSNHFRRVLPSTVQPRAKQFTTSNVYGLFRLSSRLLKSIPYVVIKNDKDNGFSFVHRDSLHLLGQETLIARSYEPVSIGQINFDTVMAEYTALARKIQEHEGIPGMAALINSSLDGQIATKLGYTVKTHKEQGDVRTRALHLAIQPAFLGLSSWLTWSLEGQIRQL